MPRDKTPRLVFLFFLREEGLCVSVSPQAPALLLSELRRFVPTLAETSEQARSREFSPTRMRLWSSSIKVACFDLIKNKNLCALNAFDEAQKP